MFGAMKRFGGTILDWASGVHPLETVRFISKLMTPLKFPRDGKREINAAVEIESKIRKEAEVTQKRQNVVAEPDPGVTKAWWKAFKPSQIVAMDCEMVEIKKLDVNKNQYIDMSTGIFKAGTVAIVNSEGNPILNKRIYYPESSFVTNPHTERVSGFRKDSLLNGEDFEKVKAEVEKMLEDKLIIVCGGKFMDFKCLDLNPDKYQKFDLSQFFYKIHYNPNYKGKTINDIGLRSLVFHFYNVDIQSGSHSALVDAEYTMKIFMEQYTKLKVENIDDPNDRKRYHDIFKEVKHVNDRNIEALKNEIIGKC
ncbi:unnamed protein product [Allacma fusca]|uniref:Exonuclease domain-containing protein n=1 Tax=Allacma fusca TaxID=39272 RepID=A0A8J2PD07_9HEXA|nr:unnamed protein product [Allacma fusca]